MGTESHDETSESRVLSHLLQLDHWTFLLALGLVAANVAVNARALSALAGILLGIALVYDVYEFYAEE